ncbi:hypothetical protein AURDEDRAFT_185020 [Auricularia subglabra TFB-10046 SS5]|uniref:DUF4470 domain-containing protein n=1 Tax=Auricularia subglabra (strain TFB-10046 / SS5) TaxID=717982 RepID=J0LKV6_AURST|nr:hypothetical protein AURDEDRAFT_185020 [Auricularia subglabra TFB-10046 SS5]
MADKLKESGNASFTSGRYEDAAKFYAEAAALAPNDPVYLSNLSAAQFELGDYGACATTIIKAAPLLDNATDALRLKLTHRLARALCHGRMGSGFLPQDHEAVDRFEAMARADAANSEAGAIWTAWRTLQRTDLDSLRADAQQTLTKLRLFKNMQASYGISYFTVGQDDVESLLLSAPRVPDLELSEFDATQLSQLNFLIGGCGDSRHAFGTISDIHQVMLGHSMSQSQKNAVKIHMTLVDIHPTTVARVLLYLNLLSQLASSLDTEDEEEAAATFLYTFIAPVIPDYIHIRITRAMQQIVTQLETNKLPAWLIGPADPVPVIASLRHWVSLKVDTRDYMNSIPVHIDCTLDEQLSIRLAGMQVSPEYYEGVRRHYSQAERDALERNLSLPEDLLRERVPGGARMNRAQLYAYVEKVTKKNIHHFVDRVARAGMFAERKVYPRFKTIIPSMRLREKYHVQMHALALDVCLMNIDPWDLRDAPTGLPTRETMAITLTHMYKKWRANPLTFDRNMLPTRSGYPDCDWDTHGIIRGLEENFGWRIVGRKAEMEELERNSDALTFTRGVLFFRRAARAFKALRGRLTFEVVTSDVFAWLEKLKLGLARPAGSMYPTKYTRMWLSNVPDYGGGPLNVAVFAAPCFQSPATACASFNIYLSRGTWKNVEHYNYHYSLMKIDDLPHAVGCVLNGTSTNGNFSISLPPAQQHRDLAPRPELARWLVRLFLSLVYHGRNGVEHTGARIDMPNTLAFFFRVLIHLHDFVGFPGHFLADTLQIFLSDKIISDARPHTSDLPIVPQEGMLRPRKLHLAPWLAELRAIAVQVRGALPFYVSLELRQKDLVQCEAPFSMPDDIPEASTPRQPALGLILYSPQLAPRRLPDIYKCLIEGEYATEAHVFTGFDVDHSEKIVRWTMEAKQLRAAHGSGWSLAMFRLESGIIASGLVPASSWVLPANCA